MIGQPFDNKKVRDVVAGLGVKRVGAADNGPGALSSSIIWIAKAAVRIDVYRPKELSQLTATPFADSDVWLVGSVQFLAAGADDRIKTPFAGPLPAGLTMDSTPQDCIAAYGPADLDDEHERPGFSGRVLGWRKGGLNTAITFDYKGGGCAMLNHTVCLVGCMGAWRYTYAEVFAP